MKGSENEVSQSFKKYRRLERNRGKDLLSRKIEEKDSLRKNVSFLFTFLCLLGFTPFSLTGISSLSVLAPLFIRGATLILGKVLCFFKMSISFVHITPTKLQYHPLDAGSRRF